MNFFLNWIIDIVLLDDFEKFGMQFKNIAYLYIYSKDFIEE